jgi:hypothetical protein
MRSTTAKMAVPQAGGVIPVDRATLPGGERRRI